MHAFVQGIEFSDPSFDYLSQEEIKRIKAALSFAEAAHSNQYRLSGEMYISHPIQVALILVGLRLDAVSIIAGLLHDVVEDTKITQEDITEQFGQDVSSIVAGVTKISHVKYSSPLKRESENYRKMFLSMSKDIRVIIVKLADRLHNMRTIQVMPAHKRKRLAHETLDVYAPIAKRLGMQMLSMELEELGFAALYPVRYMILLSQMYKLSMGQAEILAHIEKEIRYQAHKQGIEIMEISAREKQLYGIYRKMQKQKSFTDLLDVYALRVCVKDIPACYAVIGILHGMYMPRPKSFKDYIASPKRNGYQSLHTVLYGPHGTPIEIQVRTEDMHIMATQGIASHWLYKSGQSEFQCRRHEAWFNQLADAKLKCDSDAKFIDIIKNTVRDAELFVLTPKGKIIELKVGSTVLDFAYTIHTDIGHKCELAIVDRERAPLSQKLENGQTVEIVTNNSVCPKQEWLEFVKTSRAKNAIKAFLREQNICSQDQLGFQILSYAFEKQGMSFLVNRRLLDDLLEHAGMSIPEIYGKLGRGEVDPGFVVDACQIDYLHQQSHHHEKPISIEAKPGAESFATCCHPLPGDRIAAILLPNEGLVVHRVSCRVIEMQQKKVLSATWGDVGDRLFTAVCSLVIQQAENSLMGCLSILGDMKITVLGFRQEVLHGKQSYVLTLQVRSAKHLDLVLRSIRQLKTTESARRELR